MPKRVYTLQFDRSIPDDGGAELVQGLFAKLDEASGHAYNNLLYGLRQMGPCRRVETRYAPWREAVVWQGGYFTVFPTLAVCLAHFHARLPTSYK